MYCSAIPLSTALSFELFVQHHKLQRSEMFVFGPFYHKIPYQCSQVTFYHSLQQLRISRLIDVVEIEGLQLAIHSVLGILHIMLSKWSKVCLSLLYRSSRNLIGSSYLLSSSKQENWFKYLEMYMMMSYNCKLSITEKGALQGKEKTGGMVVGYGLSFQLILKVGNERVDNVPA